MQWKPLNTRNPPLAVATGDNGSTHLKPARSMLRDYPWKIRFKKQLNGSWILTQLVDQHEKHQLEGFNALAYPENRPLSPEARKTMIDLVQHSSAPLRRLGQYLTLRTDCSCWVGTCIIVLTNYTQSSGTSTAKFIETRRDLGYIYRVMLARDNTLKALSFTSVMIFRKRDLEDEDEDEDEYNEEIADDIWQDAWLYRLGENEKG
ncbi:hypothetical protein V1527DRAFT_492992 [Lipomyces starkeyi]